MRTGKLDHRSTPLWPALRLGESLRAAALGASFSVALALGCAATPAPRPAVSDEAPAPERVDTGATYFESEIGGMNEYAVEDTFKSLARPIGRCFESGSERVEQIGGSFTVSFRVDRKGKTRWAHLKASTIGDRATEACILDLVRNQAWPKPLSGEGLAEKTFDIEPSSAPHVLDEKRVRSVTTLARTKTAPCRKGVQGAFRATAYLEPDGRVRAAGVATPNEKAESAADCIVSELQKLKFAAPKKLAKVTFEI